MQDSRSYDHSKFTIFDLWIDYKDRTLTNSPFKQPCFHDPVDLGNSMKLYRMFFKKIYFSNSISKVLWCLSIITVQSSITAQDDKVSKKNKRTGWESSYISMACRLLIFREICIKLYIYVQQILLRCQICHLSKLAPYYIRGSSKLCKIKLFSTTFLHHKKCLFEIKSAYVLYLGLLAFKRDPLLQDMSRNVGLRLIWKS